METDDIISFIAKNFDEYVIKNTYIKMLAEKLGLSEELVSICIFSFLIFILTMFARSFVKVIIAILLIISFISITKGDNFECIGGNVSFKDKACLEICEIIDEAKKKQNAKFPKEDEEEFNRISQKCIERLRRIYDTLHTVEKKSHGATIYNTATSVVSVCLKTSLGALNSNATFYPCKISVATRIEDAIAILEYKVLIFNKTLDVSLKKELLEEMEIVDRSLGHAIAYNAKS